MSHDTRQHEIALQNPKTRDSPVEALAIRCLGQGEHRARTRCQVVNLDVGMVLTDACRELYLKL